MDLDWIGALRETFKYMIGGIAGAFVSLSIGLPALGQFVIVIISFFMLFLMVLFSREAMPKTQERRLEKVVRDSIEKSVSVAVQESIHEEQQKMKKNGGD